MYNNWPTNRECSNYSGDYYQSTNGLNTYSVRHPPFYVYALLLLFLVCSSVLVKCQSSTLIYTLPPKSKKVHLVLDLSLHGAPVCDFFRRNISICSRTLSPGADSWIFTGLFPSPGTHVLLRHLRCLLFSHSSDPTSIMSPLYWGIMHWGDILWDTNSIKVSMRMIQIAGDLKLLFCLCLSKYSVPDIRALLFPSLLS